MQTRPLTVGTVIEKNRIASENAMIPLLEIDVVDPVSGVFVETLRVAHNEENITYLGHIYSAGGFELDLVKDAGELVNLTVTVIDYTRAIQGRMQEYGGGVGFAVRLIVINSANMQVPPEVKEEFQVISARAHNFLAIFTLGAENPLTMRFPRRQQFKDRCQWRYRGAECGYTGPLPTCDFSLQGTNGCAAHNNALRFGAFPGIRRVY